jgi:hypothetical protein
VAHGIRGGKAKSLQVIDDNGHAISLSTTTRRLRATGLPGPGHLLRDARLTGAQLRETRSVSAKDSALAAGFGSQRERRRADRRKA